MVKPYETIPTFLGFWLGFPCFSVAPLDALRQLHGKLYASMDDTIQTGLGSLGSLLSLRDLKQR